jgi:HKD family nuclease
VDVSIEVLAGSHPLGRRLIDDMKRAERLSLAAAFAKESVLDAIPLAQWCRANRQLRVLAGTDFFLTEMQLLRRLETRPGATCRIYHSARSDESFHPKVYVLDSGDRRVAYVGSSNLSRGGFAGNVEANVRIEGPSSAAPLARPLEFFEEVFESEFATTISADFQQRYDEMQRAQRAALLRNAAYTAYEHLRVAENMLLSAYRSTHAAQRWLLVVSPSNYEICMRSKTWGRQRESEIRSYRPGDVFFFHVTQRSRVATMGMFTGQPYFDSSPLWQRMDRGSFPWRIGFVELGTLVNGINTREVLEPLHPGAPRHFFNGYLQASHSLEPSHFEALRTVFESALRLERIVA